MWFKIFDLATWVMYPVMSNNFVSQNKIKEKKLCKTAYI